MIDNCVKIDPIASCSFFCVVSHDNEFVTCVRRWHTEDRRDQQKHEEIYKKNITTSLVWQWKFKISYFLSITQSSTWDVGCRSKNVCLCALLMLDRLRSSPPHFFSPKNIIYKLKSSDTTCSEPILHHPEPSTTTTKISRCSAWMKVNWRRRQGDPMNVSELGVFMQKQAH